MASKLSGGCACGAIRYESDAEPTVMLNCHCSDCRKASGSGHAAIVIVQKSTLQQFPNAQRVERLADFSRRWRCTAEQEFLNHGALDRR